MYILCGIWVIITLFTSLVLSIGSPEHEISPDPKLEGMLLEGGFWVSVLFWGFLGSAMPLIWVKFAGKDGRNMILFMMATALSSVLAYDIYAPFSAAWPIGLAAGILIEGWMWRRNVAASPLD